MDDDAARDLVAGELRRLFAELRPEADLQVVDPLDPTALFAAVQAADGRRLAQLSAHAAAVTVLLGADGAPCAFTTGTPAERAVRAAGAVAATLVLYRVPLHPAPVADVPPPTTSRHTVRAGDVLAVPDPDGGFRIAEVVDAGEAGLRVWAYENRFEVAPRAVDPGGLRRIALHAQTGAPADVPWAEFDTWHAVPVRRRQG